MFTSLPANAKINSPQALYAKEEKKKKKFNDNRFLYDRGDSWHSRDPHAISH